MKSYTKYNCTLEKYAGKLQKSDDEKDYSPKSLTKTQQYNLP